MTGEQCDVDRLLELRTAIDAEAKALRERIGALGTREEWSAYNDLLDAARDIHGAAGWLARHDAKHDQQKYDTKGGQGCWN